MDGRSGSPEAFKHFKKDEFEADWIKLAECRFSQVYQVKVKLWREKCALKCFGSTMSVGNFYRELIDEVSKMVKLKFRYIISVFGLCTEANAVVMEYMSNGSLNNLLATHTLMWPKKFQMIHEASMGMNFLHSMKPPLLHLNLKTSNILLDDHLHVKISDFGLIHWEADMNKTALMERLTAKGNISYIPPEIFTQCPDPPGTTFDVYSFGIVIWEILTQQKPYTGSSMTTVLLQVSQGKRPCLTMMPDQRPHECDQMISIMKQCWHQNRETRPPFSDTVRKTEALNDVLRIAEPVVHGHKDGDVGIFQAKIRMSLTGLNNSLFPERSSGPSDDQPGEDDVLSFLSKKDYSSFRQSVRKEHVLTQFSGQKNLLHYTVASGDLESVEHVLSLGAEVNCTTARGYTPLIVAVLQRFYNIVVLLLEHGADPTQGDEDQWTPLHFAAQNGDEKTARLLLDKGALPDVGEKDGWKPIHLASQNGHETMVRLLLSRLSEEAVLEPEMVQGRTSLHLASRYGHLNIVKLLLSHGADPSCMDSSLSNPLHFAAEQGHNRVVRQLIKTGASADKANSKGYTPLHLAALNGHSGICRQLLSNGSNPNSKTLQGWTAMHLAALRGHNSVVVQLESRGGCVDSKGQKGWTPLHLACRRSEVAVVEKLLALTANPNIPLDVEGWTPLHVACTSVSFPCVVHLITHHADVNAVNSGKTTPLHLAAQHGCVPIVQALLLNGADQTLQDSSGFTALNVARRCEKWEIVQILENNVKHNQSF